MSDVISARRIAAAGGQVLFGRCDQEAIVPYQPIVEARDGVALRDVAEITIEALEDSELVLVDALQ